MMRVNFTGKVLRSGVSKKGNKYLQLLVANGQGYDVVVGMLNGKSPDVIVGKDYNITGEATVRVVNVMEVK